MPETEKPLFAVFIEKFNLLGHTYMVTGSVAGTLYGEPRVTHDVDIVLQLPAARPVLDRFVETFPLEDFYCPPWEVLLEEALRSHHGHFNLIHHDTGFRADVYLANSDLLHTWALKRRRPLQVDGTTLHVAPPEYVILRKLQFYKEGQSEKHLRDIRHMLSVSGENIQTEVIRDWATKLGVDAEWQSFAVSNRT